MQSFLKFQMFQIVEAQITIQASLACEERAAKNESQGTLVEPYQHVSTYNIVSKFPSPCHV